MKISAQKPPKKVIMKVMQKLENAIEKEPQLKFQPVNAQSKPKDSKEVDDEAAIALVKTEPCEILAPG